MEVGLILKSNPRLSLEMRDLKAILEQFLKQFLEPIFRPSIDNPFTLEHFKTATPSSTP
jgi:hypothetical protein